MDEIRLPPEEPVSDKLFFILRRADQAIYVLGNELFGEIGLTVQQAVVLSFIWHNKGCNQLAVEEHLQTRSASVTVLLATMAAKGLVEKTRNPVDGRGVILTLTARGRRTVGKVQGVFGEITRRATAGIGDGELETVKAILRRIADNIAAEPRRASVRLGKKSARTFLGDGRAE